MNGIHLIDNWFQGLVEFDYETKTVHFIHASVQQFFLTTPDNPAFSNFHVCLEDADRHIGDVCITYLNFSDFKTTLARIRPPLPPIAPDEICQTALSNEWSWPRLLRLSQRLHGKKRRAADIDATFASYTRAADETIQETILLDHPFLPYASAHWLSHSVNFDQEHCQTWSLWMDMLIWGHELAASPVSEEHHRLINEALVLWAAQNRHSPLLHVVVLSADLREQYETVLFDYMIKENDFNILHYMLNEDILNPMLNSLCCRAAHDGCLEVIKMLFDAGVDINSIKDSSDHRSYLPLTEAIDQGHIEVIEYLLQKGADPNSQTEPCTPLESAAILGGLKGLQACKLLIDAGAKMDNTKALLMSCARGDREIIKLLLSAGVDINASFPAPRLSFLSVGIWINYQYPHQALTSTHRKLIPLCTKKPPPYWRLSPLQSQMSIILSF